MFPGIQLKKGFYFFICHKSFRNIVLYSFPGAGFLLHPSHLNFFANPNEAVSKWNKRKRGRFFASPPTFELMCRPKHPSPFGEGWQKFRIKTPEGVRQNVPA
jgi:hypothetical protein